MKMEESTGYVARCFNGEPASCTFACPFSLDIRGFLEKVSKGRWAPAYKLLRNAVVFPTVVGALCPQPCRGHCQRRQLGDESLSMSDLEEACITYAKNRKAEVFVIPPKTQRVAIIGAGPAGLSCALSLAQKKYNVTVFEKESGWGGSLRQHPRFDEFNEDFKLQFSGVEVDLQFNSEIKDLGELAEYDAVYISTGKTGDDFGLLHSWDNYLLTTSNPKVFIGGERTGVTLMEAIAQGSEASKIIESFLATGKASRQPGPDRSKCERYLNHEGAEKKPLVLKLEGEVYTEEEAKAEAARCFQCDCRYCEDSCEMLQWFRKKPHKIGLEVYTDSIATSVVSPKTMTRETYSCNICGKCKSVCPVDVDIGDLLQFSRTDRKSAGKDIPALHDYWLREFDFHSTEAFFAAPPKGKETCDYVFFPGCQLGAANPEHVTQSYDYLVSRYDTGIVVGCCGAPAYWAGDMKRFQENAEKIKAEWAALGKPAFVFACAYCEKVFSMFLPDIPRVSLYALMGEDKSLKPARPFDTAAVFDPCAARHDDMMQEGVRKLAQNAGMTLEELKEKNRCCGYGGHMRLANPGLYEQITEHRTEASDKPYIVYCANCQEVFKQKGKNCTHILDMVFSLDTKQTMPSLAAKKDNSLEVKKMMMKNITGEDFTPEPHPWDGIILEINEDLLEEMDRKLIIADDLKEAIYLAEQSGDMFYDEESGVSQCSMVKSVITYWVQYKEQSPGTYAVISAYSHRMRFSREG